MVDEMHHERAARLRHTALAVDEGRRQAQEENAAKAREGR